MTTIRQPVHAAEHRGHCPETCSPCDQKHDEDLVFDRLNGRHAAKDLPGHHARQRNETGRRHGIDGRHQRCEAHRG